MRLSIAAAALLGLVCLLAVLALRERAPAPGRAAPRSEPVIVPSESEDLRASSSESARSEPVLAAAAEPPPAASERRRACCAAFFSLDLRVPQQRSTAAPCTRPARRSPSARSASASS
jgi:hypothetical protein